MRQKRTFKLIYEWTKYPPNRKHFQRYNASLKRAENVVTLRFNNSSATEGNTATDNLLKLKSMLSLPRQGL